MLYEGVARGTTTQRGRYIKVFTVNARDRELTHTAWSKSTIPSSAHLLIPVPKPTGGVVVVGDSAITYVDSVSDPVTVICQAPTINCYTLVEDGSDNAIRFLLGDTNGLIYILVLLKNLSGKVTSLAIDHVGSTSIPHSLSYLDHGVLFVGSVLGDSKLLRLRNPGSSASASNSISTSIGREDDSDSRMTDGDIDIGSRQDDIENQSFEVLDVFSNVGPILDMCVVDANKQGNVGSSIVVTCSGAGKNGSIRVHRSGIGINEQV